MFKPNFPKRGVALFMVLGTIAILVILANIIISIISSQSRLTHHQVSRIQAYYATLAGMNYAYEMLRSGAWAPGNCPGPGGCLLSTLDPQFAATFPFTIRDVRIVLIIPGPGVAGCDTTAAIPVPAGITACIQTTATYTYTQ